MTIDELLDEIGERIDWDDTSDRVPCPECGQRPICYRCTARIEALTGAPLQQVPAQWEMLF